MYHWQVRLLGTCVVRKKNIAVDARRGGGARAVGIQEARQRQASGGSCPYTRRVRESVGEVGVAAVAVTCVCPSSARTIERLSPGTRTLDVKVCCNV